MVTESVNALIPRDAVLAAFGGALLGSPALAGERMSAFAVVHGVNPDEARVCVEATLANYDLDCDSD
jgi:hypothetical protein